MKFWHCAAYDRRKRADCEFSLVLLGGIDEIICSNFSFLNDLDRVTEYNYVPTDGARHDTLSWTVGHLC